MRSSSCVARLDYGLGRAEAPPSLRRVITLAQEQAPDVVMGGASVGVARSGLVGARRSLLGNPYLEVTGARAMSGSWGNTAVLGQLWVPLEISGQRSTRIDEANASIELQRRSLGLARALAAADAVRAYGTAVVASELLADSSGVAPIERARFLIGELRAALGWLFDDSANKAASAQLFKIDQAHDVATSQDAINDPAECATLLGMLQGALGWDSIHPIPPAIAESLNEARTALAVAKFRSTVVMCGRVDSDVATYYVLTVDAEKSEPE